MEEIIKFVQDNSGNGYSAIYRTSQTKELDKLFGLTGTPVDDETIKKLQAPAIWLGKTEPEMVMQYFAFVAGKYGSFVGLPFEEVARVTRGKISTGDLTVSHKKGYLDCFEHENILVVSPTTKYSL